jgi:copper type II ascorbate-dependent monooxygenase-like protein
VVGLWPHLHARGTHVKMVVSHGASTSTVLDAPYALDHQPIVPASLALHAADTVQATCTYVNDTGHTVTYGESTAAEQCFVGMYVWPSDGLSIFDCAN